jgi:GTPase SAR1 family protein
MMYKMSVMDSVVNTIPTIGFNVEQVQQKNVKLLCWDIGGPDKVLILIFFSLF